MKEETGCKMRRSKKVSGWVLGGVAGCMLLAGELSGWGEETPSVKLEEALQEMRALKARLIELEKVIDSISDEMRAGEPAPGEPIGSAEPPRQAEREESRFVKWNELSLGESRFKLYGFLRLDAIYDDSRPNSRHTPAFILSEDPAAPAPIGAPRDASSFTMHPKLTRLGLDFTGPEAGPLWNARTSGKLEIDFYNAPPSESRQAPRLRHGYLKLDWLDFSLLAGQTTDVISPLFPSINPDFVMWGAGNLGDRRPQLRGQYAPRIGPGQVIFQGGIGLTGANDNQDLDQSGFRDGESSGKPTLQARLAYRYPLWERQQVELGVWGHRAWEKTDQPIGVPGRRDFDSDAIGLDLMLPLYADKAWLRGEIWQGKNLSDVRGGILQGINVVTGREVHARGGWIELGGRPHRFHSLHGGFSTDDPRDRDLPDTGRALNRIWYFGWRGYFDPIEVGLDYLYWTTRYVGFGPGRDNRIQSYMSYKF